MERIMFDTNINDAVADDKELNQLLIIAQRKALIRLLTTHIQRDEISAIPEQEKRARVESVHLSAESIQTFGAIVGVSRLDNCRFGDDTFEKLGYTPVGGGPVKHPQDALIASTALREADILVTNDKQFAKKIKGALMGTPTNLRIMNAAELKEYIRKLITPANK